MLVCLGAPPFSVRSLQGSVKFFGESFFPGLCLVPDFSLESALAEFSGCEVCFFFSCLIYPPATLLPALFHVWYYAVPLN